MVMSKENFLIETIETLLSKHKEGAYWDFKQEWHEKIEDLMKDIICFSNTPHDQDCYIIFGISNDCNVLGMKKDRKKQADIIDCLSKLDFAGGCQPEISVDTVVYSDIELDILTIYNTEKTPIYLNTNYGKMLKGCIYLRKGDRNTPDNGNANIGDIELLWKKRLGLTKSPLDIVYELIDKPFEWNKIGDTYYHKYRPEYSINIIYDEDAYFHDYYLYQPEYNNSIIGVRIVFRYYGTRLDQKDGFWFYGSFIPLPRESFLDVGFENTIRYVYITEDSEENKILRFFSYFGPVNAEYVKLGSSIIFYTSKTEKNHFEYYLRKNIQNVFGCLELLKKENTLSENMLFAKEINKRLKDWRKHSS